MAVAAVHWLNGEEGARLPLNDRGLAYGDGLFETFEQHTAPGALAPLAQHLSPEERKISERTKLEGTVFELRKFLRLEDLVVLLVAHHSDAADGGCPLHLDLQFWRLAQIKRIPRGR